MKTMLPLTLAPLLALTACQSTEPSPLLTRTISLGKGVIGTRLAFHPEGRYLVTGMVDGDLSFHDVKTGEPILFSKMQAPALRLQVPKLPEKQPADKQPAEKQLDRIERMTVTSLAVSPDGNRVAATYQSPARFSTFRVFDLTRDGQALAMPVDSDYYYSCAAWDESGTRLAVGTNSNRIIIYENLAKPREILFGPDEMPVSISGSSVRGGVFGLAFTADGKGLVGSGNAYCVRLMDPDTGEDLAPPNARLKTLAGGVFFGDRLYNVRQNLALVPGTNQAAIKTADAIAIVDLATGKVLRKKPLAEEGRFTSLAISPDGRQMAAGDTKGRVHVWVLASDDPPEILNGHIGAVYGVAFAPDGTVIASTGRDGTTRIWKRPGSPNQET